MVDAVAAEYASLQRQLSRGSGEGEAGGQRSRRAGASCLPPRPPCTRAARASKCPPDRFPWLTHPSACLADASASVKRQLDALALQLGQLSLCVQQQQQQLVHAAAPPAQEARQACRLLLRCCTWRGAVVSSPLAPPSHTPKPCLSSCCWPRMGLLPFHLPPAPPPPCSSTESKEHEGVTYLCFDTNVGAEGRAPCPAVLAPSPRQPWGTLHTSPSVPRWPCLPSSSCPPCPPAGVDGSPRPHPVSSPPPWPRCRCRFRRRLPAPD